MTEIRSGKTVAGCCLSFFIFIGFSVVLDFWFLDFLCQKYNPLLNISYGEYTLFSA